MKRQVTKILFSTTTTLPRVATGVQFGTKSGASYTAYAKHEVIVAAGAIGVSHNVCYLLAFSSHCRASVLQSPTILQLSGIGNAARLTSLGIQPVVNLTTVGLNLQEQVR